MDLNSKLAAIQAQLDAARGQLSQIGGGNLPTRPLPDRPLPAPAAPEPFVESPLRANVRATLGELGQVGKNALGLAPLGLHPLGAALNAGTLLGNLATVGMHAYERQKLMTQGGPLERAQRDYGKGIEARIARKAPTQRKFR